MISPRSLLIIPSVSRVVQEQHANAFRRDSRRTWSIRAGVKQSLRQESSLYSSPASTTRGISRENNCALWHINANSPSSSYDWFWIFEQVNNDTLMTKNETNNGTLMTKKYIKNISVVSSVVFKTTTIIFFL